MAKTKASNVKYILHILCGQWTWGDMKFWLLSRVSGMTEVNTCGVFNSFWYSQIFLHYCNIPNYKHAHTH